ncbi:hypothetical protein [Comamonas sp. Z1]|uniref:hypothetical protein n=1 Tax=Comamonas sp. Z1 TaxID=2601246 RepID=UPI0011E61F80|nr:hypothetical protein [Comamonas sp. Z1]
MSALQIQQERERADLQNHKERVEWLSAASPEWSCGTPVDGFTQRTLLNQSKDAIKFYAQRAAQAAHGGPA